MSGSQMRSDILAKWGLTSSEILVWIFRVRICSSLLLVMACKRLLPPGSTSWWSHCGFAPRIWFHAVTWPTVRRNSYHRWVLVGSLAYMLNKYKMSCEQILHYSDECTVFMQFSSRYLHKLNMASICCESSKMSAKYYTYDCILDQSNRGGTLRGFSDLNRKRYVR